MVARGTLTEVGSRIREEPDRNRRRLIEDEIHSSARVLAGQIALDRISTTDIGISRAIHDGIEELVKIYGGSS